MSLSLLIETQMLRFTGSDFEMSSLRKKVIPTCSRLLYYICMIVPTQHFIQISFVLHNVWVVIFYQRPF